MDELEKAATIAASTEVRAAALPRFDRQIATWGVALPDTELLVLDFGLDQFDSVGLIESWVANESAAGYCGKYLFVSDGQTCPMYHHKHKHETFFVVEGRIRVVLGDDIMELAKGDRLTVPTQIKHSFTGVGPALLLELSQPCLIDDNYFEDTRIPIGGNYQDSDR
jgi:mannose-6-phosphate isomerase-like protein (cupin superfamily)